MCRGVLLERMLVDLAVVLHQSSGDVLQVCPRNVGGAVTDNDRYSRNRGVSTPCRLAEEAFRQGENETYCMTQVVGGDEIDDLFASKKSAARSQAQSESAPTPSPVASSRGIVTSSQRVHPGYIAEFLPWRILQQNGCVFKQRSDLALNYAEYAKLAEERLKAATDRIVQLESGQTQA